MNAADKLRVRRILAQHGLGAILAELANAASDQSVRAHCAIHRLAWSRAQVALELLEGSRFIDAVRRAET
jgi:hypothetical protein